MNIIVHTHLLAVLVTATAAFTDHRTGRIPNWLTLPPLLGAPLLFWFLAGTQGLLASLTGLFVCALAPYFLYRKDAIGGGDVKLFAALGALLGLSVGVEAQLMSLIAAGFYALLRLAVTKKLGAALKTSWQLMINPFLPKARRKIVEREQLTSIRLGGSILVGTTIAVVLRHPGLWQ